jgi:hypothetical protein
MRATAGARMKARRAAKTKSRIVWPSRPMRERISQASAQTPMMVRVISRRVAQLVRSFIVALLARDRRRVLRAAVASRVDRTDPATAVSSRATVLKEWPPGSSRFD